MEIMIKGATFSVNFLEQSNWQVISLLCGELHFLCDPQKNVKTSIQMQKSDKNVGSEFLDQYLNWQIDQEWSMTDWN